MASSRLRRLLVWKELIPDNDAVRRPIAIALTVGSLVRLCECSSRTRRNRRTSACWEGVVLDPSGAPIPDMTVTDRTDGWAAVLRATTTDSKGHFRFSQQRGKSVYNLRFEHPLFNPLQLRLKLDKKVHQRGIIARPHIGGWPVPAPHGNRTGKHSFEFSLFISLFRVLWVFADYFRIYGIVFANRSRILLTSTG